MSRNSISMHRVVRAVLVAGATFGATACYGPYKPRSLQRVIGAGLVAEYDSHSDRLVRFGPRGRFNLLHVRDDAEPVSGDPCTHRGGMYSWVSPQSAWTDEQRRYQPWPPPTAMDRGPTRATRHALNEFEALGPVLPNGLREVKGMQLGRDQFGQRAVVTHGLINTSDSVRRGGVWLSTAAIPGSVIAVITPSDGRTVQFSTHPGAAEVWENVTRSRSRWTLVRTKRYYDWLGLGGTFKVRVPSDRVIAIHRRGHWLVRVGEPWSPEADTRLEEMGHAPVEVAVNFGRRIHEAALLGPILEIAPGSRTDYREHWYIIPGAASRVRQLDRFLYDLDPLRFPLPDYLVDEEDDSELREWLGDEEEEMRPQGEPPAEVGRDAHDEPPIDVDDVQNR